MEIAATSIVLTLFIALFSCFLAQRKTLGMVDRLLQRSIPSGVLPEITIEFGYWLLMPFVAVLRRLQVTPNMLSLFSLPVAIIAAISLGAGRFGVGGAILLVAFGLDACDGLLARETAVASDAGEVVDATLDRYTDVITMLGFLYYYRFDVLPWLLTGAALVGTVIVSYIRAKGQAFGIDPAFGSFQRHERGFYLSIAAMIAPATAILAHEPAEHPRYYAAILALGAVAVGTNITAVSRACFVVNRLRAPVGR